MAYYHDDVYDHGLQALRDATTPILHICDPEPTTFAEATATYTLGNKTAPALTALAPRTGGGRKVDISTFTDGSVTANGTGKFWALVDANDNRLLAVADIAELEQQVLTSGNALALSSVVELGFGPAGSP
ncbi:hypothetical protein [Pukyongiella litopenaei]|uniref:Uncharacterized protein n=1 Tax=Pukyongiella litopenaei TaxID=2605946 RepID=A0A2S0ML29_9RHOB|nr:hypothetical protein [Pukyongiella litopenaei]AVO36590.1 hypothetical protein C6Y53_01995 [Pukyongiella litopenaei]